MRLHFIRHAQSGNNALYARSGTWLGREADPEITELGHLQSVHLAAYAGEHLRDTTHIYCSLMVRAIQTASYVADALQMPLGSFVDIHEKSGTFERDEVTEVEQSVNSHPRSYFEHRFPKLTLPESLGEDGWWQRPPEDWATTQARGERVIEQLVAAHRPDDNVVIVSHAGFYQGFMRALLKMPESMWHMRFRLDNTAITTIEFSESQVMIERHNDTRFLPAEAFRTHTQVNKTTDK